MKTKILNTLKYGHVVTNSRIPKLLSWVITIKAITIYPFIIFRDEADEETIRHEKIHIAQQKELFVLPFYILYFGYWLINKLKYKDSGSEAYYNIPFEQEAYKNSGNEFYFLARPKQAWKHYNVLRNH